MVKAALAESEEARRLSEAARRDLKRQMEKAMLEHEDEIEALKQELAEQRLKQPPPPPLPAAGKSKAAAASGGGSQGGSFTTVQLMLVALLGLLLGFAGQLPFGAERPWHSDPNSDPDSNPNTLTPTLAPALALALAQPGAPQPVARVELDAGPATAAAAAAAAAAKPEIEPEPEPE